MIKSSEIGDPGQAPEHHRRLSSASTRRELCSRAQQVGFWSSGWPHGLASQGIYTVLRVALTLPLTLTTDPNPNPNPNPSQQCCGCVAG